jgi:competence ComEA-like helix-hairpin-helix protein
VNINTADVVELDTLPEIGPATAVKIIAYREANGPFVRIEDIMNVSGIKEATFAKIKDYITVGGGSGDTGGTGGDTGGEMSTTTATTTPPTATTTSTGGSVTYSVHYIQESLSNYEPTNIFKISAGRERLALVDIPLTFEAKYTISSDLQRSQCSYTWSFGDGASGTGEKVVHTYKYTGDYNVVLNGKCRDLLAVSRTVVKVLTPELVIKQNADGAVTVSNNGKYEINLYGWKLSSSNIKCEFVFPLDTIVSAGSVVTFPAENLKLAGATGLITLSDTANKYSFQTGVNSLAKGNADRQITLQDIERFALVYKSLIKDEVRAPAYASAVNVPTPIPVAVNAVAVSPALSHSPKMANDLPLTASVISTVLTGTTTGEEENTASTSGELAGGFWSKIFHPFRTIKDTFYK